MSPGSPLLISLGTFVLAGAACYEARLQSIFGVAWVGLFHFHCREFRELRRLDNPAIVC